MSDVVVFGVGMSWIACAKAQQAEGAFVRLIDKGRYIGERMATRRTVVAGKAIMFDYGAQYLDQSEDAAATAAAGKSAVDVWHLGD